MPYALIFDNVEEVNEVIQKMSERECFIVNMKFINDDEWGMF